MMIFGVYKRLRLTLEVAPDTTVQELKEEIKERIGISGDSNRQDEKVLVLSYAGAELSDHWILSDLVLVPGTTIKIQLKDNVQPALYIKCSHNREVIRVFEGTTITSQPLEQFRSLASTLSGLPVGIFRLATQDGREMFDSHSLEDYGVQVGDIVLLETWDGEGEFINVAIMGFTQQVLSQVSGDDVVARFQLKVALFIASHFGHVDLARCALKQGIRSDEPTGYHPSRMWCQENGHIDSFKCPVHEATQSGQVGVLRLFVNHDIACLKAKDGHGLEPLNIALRGKVKNCASLLLSKQWIKVQISKTCSLHVATYARLRRWCDRAKDRAFLKYGPGGSSQKGRSFRSGPLVSHGVFLDGFSKSPMTGKSRNELLKEVREKGGRNRVSVADVSGFSLEPENYFKALIAGNGGMGRQGRRKTSLRWRKSSVSSLSGREAVVMAPRIRSQKGKPDNITINPSQKSKPDNLTINPSQKSKPDSLTINPSKPKTTSSFVDDPQSTDNDATKHTSFMRKTSKSFNLEQAETNETQHNTINTTKGANATKINKLPNDKNELSTSISQPRKMSSTSTLNYSSQITNLNSSFNIDAKYLKEKIKTRSLESSDDAFGNDPKLGSVKKNPKSSQKFLISMTGTSSKGSVTLPDISHEQNRRPFYYYNGVREDELVGEAMKLVTKYKGDSSRQRALTTLSLASSFSEKPWLYRVKMALNLTSRSVKRDVRRLLV